MSQMVRSTCLRRPGCAAPPRSPAHCVPLRVVSGITDPYIVHELKAKLDGQGYCDNYEIERA